MSGFMRFGALAAVALVIASAAKSARAQVTCFGIPDTDPNVCSGHGACVAPDTCSCDTGYAGFQCELITCFGRTESDPAACSGNGVCVGPDTCDCYVGFVGDECHSLVIPVVTVGNPGNGGESGYGGVGYTYNISTFEVTAGQYRDFLNAVDPGGSNPYGIYDSSMDTDFRGCQITWNVGSSTYDFSGRPSGAEADWVDRPVNHVSWGAAARFCNWLHNGQPAGQLTGDPAQDAGVTEEGSYFLNGATTDAALMAVVREPDATWVIPSDDEWYKAAYHYNDGVTGNYYDYPTGSDIRPECVDDSGNHTGDGTPFVEGGTDPGNYATYDGDDASTIDGIGPPYYRTVAGEWENSGSPYGTSDQCGNVWEWTEAVVGAYRGLRGGAFDSYMYPPDGPTGTYDNPSGGRNYVGFRVAEVPALGAEIPTVSGWGLVTMALLVLTAGTVVRARRSRTAA